MRALTVPQPRATLIALGVQTIYTSARPAPSSVVGERITIHAGTQVLNLTQARAGWEKFHVDQYLATKGQRYALELFDPLPLGAVVATARLSACLPMRLCGGWLADDPEPPTLWLEHSNTTINGLVHQDEALSEHDVTDQLPFSDFSPGRWAWMLDDPQPLDEPVPATGLPGLWEWEAER